MSDGMDMENVRKELMKQTERIYVDVLKERVEVMKQEVQSLQRVVKKLKQLSDELTHAYIAQYYISSLETAVNIVEHAVSLLEIDVDGVRKFEFGEGSEE